MEFSIKSGAPQTGASGCVVVGVFETRKLSAAAAALDRASNGYLSEIIRRGDMEGKLGATLLLHNVPGVAADRVLLVGLGRSATSATRSSATPIAAAVRALQRDRRRRGRRCTSPR